MTGQPDGQGNRDSSLSRRVAVAAGWMVGLRWIDRLIGLVSVAILARVLLPDDFGIVGYAMLVIGFLELFAGISTDVELIRHQHADHAYYSAAWTMNVLRGFAIGFLMLLLAEPATSFFREPRLAPVMLALAAIPIIGGFENVGIVDFRKHLQFDREFRFHLTSRILATVATIALALALRSYWALAVGSILRSTLVVGLSYWFHPFRPRFALAKVPEVFSFSLLIVVPRLSSSVNENSLTLVFGREFASSALAFFNVGREIADLSATEIRAPIRRALYPGLAQISERRQRIGEVLVESTGVFALLTLPIPLGLALVAEDFIPLFLGSRWGPTIGVLQPLCLAAAFGAVTTNSPLALMATNRSGLTAVASVVRLTVLALFIVMALPHGFIGIAHAVAASSGIMLVADYTLTTRLLRIDARRFMAAIWRPITASVAMCAAVWLLRASFPPADNPAAHAWSLLRSVPVGVVVYVGCLFALWLAAGRPDGAERRVGSILQGFLARRRTGTPL